MDKKRSILNVSVAIFFKLILFALSVFARRCLIKYVGNDANGVNSLYSSIVGVLAIAELGVGSAITFSMYQPIINNEKEKIAALYKLFIKIYRIIAGLILIAGLAITPFLPLLTKNYQADFNLYITFIIMLISVAFTYTYSAKISLINAYKNNYITTTITSIGQILLYILQVIVLILFQSFELFLISRIISEVLQSLLVNLYVKRHYNDIITITGVLDESTKLEIGKNVKAMFMHKLGGVLINSTDSIIISAFVGVVTLGLYSNYTIIMSAMAGVLGLFFSPLTSVIGHLCAEHNIQEEKRVFNFLYFLNFSLGCIFYLGYYSIIDNLVILLFGETLTMTWEIPFIITINYFVQFMRQSVLLFRDATGTFYNDRWKPIFEGGLNIVLSILLVQWFDILGVLVATILTNLLICHVVEPFVLYKHAFQENPKKYYFLNYSCLLAFGIMLLFLHFIKISLDSIILETLLNGCFAVLLASVPILLFFLTNKAVRQSVKSIFIKRKNNE